MPRIRRNEPKKGQFTRLAMEEAIKAVRSGMKIRAAATQFSISKSTLQRYVTSSAGQEDLSQAKLTPNYACHKIFSEDAEDELTCYLIDCANMGFGLDTVQVRKLAFTLAARNHINYPKSWDSGQIAGKDWLYYFRLRHPELSMRKPEPCSKNRASAFTPEAMEVFFGNLKTALDRNPTVLERLRIWNLDEIGTTTVGAVKRKILGPSGEKQIPQSKSAERGTLVTTCCFVSAAGTTLPPAMIFPRVNFQSHMLVDAYPGTLGLAAKSGWMNEETFAQVLDHFVRHTGSSKENPTLLVMDNDASHLSLAALDIAKANGVTVVTLSPHTSHKTQPLDVAVYSPFRTYYDTAVRNWIMNNPGKPVTIYHVASFVKAAMGKAMTPATILAGFRKTGIYPFNPNIFTEADYLASVPFRETNSETTPASELENSASSANGALASALTGISAPAMTASTAAGPSMAASTAAGPSMAASTPADSSSGASSAGSSGGSFVGPYAIVGLPKAQPSGAAAAPNRRKGRSFIPTDTPEKAQIEARKAATRQKRGHTAQAKLAKALASTAGKKTKKRKSSRKSSSPASSESEDDPDPVVLADSDASETLAEEETAPLPLIDPEQTGKLPRPPQEDDYVLIRVTSVTSQGKKKPENRFRIAKVLSASNRNAEVTFLKKSTKVKNKFIVCSPPELENVPVKSIVVILPRPTVAGTRRQQHQLGFDVDFTKVSFP